MNLKDSEQYAHLKQALEVLEELKIPEELRARSLEFLLARAGMQPLPSNQDGEMPVAPDVKTSGGTKGLREFVALKNPTSAVEQIPCLLYWAKHNEQKEVFGEDAIVELFRRANLRPPKNLNQSLRDLASKKYGRLEVAKGEPGHVRLSRFGEDFVMHDLKPEDVVA